MTYSYKIKKASVLQVFAAPCGRNPLLPSCTSTALANFFPITTTTNSAKALCTFFQGGVTSSPPNQAFEQGVTTNGQVLDCTPAGASTPTPCVSSSCTGELSPPTNFDPTAIGPAMSAIADMIVSSDLCTQSTMAANPLVMNGTIVYTPWTSPYTIPPTCNITLSFNYLGGNTGNVNLTLNTGGSGLGGIITQDDCSFNSGVTGAPQTIVDLGANACPVAVNNNIGATCEDIQVMNSCNAPCNITSITAITAPSGVGIQCGALTGPSSTYNNSQCCIHLNINGSIAQTTPLDYIFQCPATSGVCKVADCPTSPTTYPPAALSGFKCITKMASILAGLNGAGSDAGSGNCTIGGALVGVNISCN